jgi:trigger factor
MQVSVLRTGSLERRVEVAVPATEVTQAVEERLKEISRTARLKGFRPGKVPYAVVRQQFGEQVRAEVVNDLVKSSFEEAIASHQLTPVSGPRIEPIAMGPGADLKYAAVFEVMPEVHLGPIESIPIVRPTASVEESDVDAMIESMRGQRPVYTAVERGARESDRVLVDFEGHLESGEQFEGGNGEDAEIIIGSQAANPQLEEGLKGATAGEERTIALQFSVSHRRPELAGKTAQLHVRIKRVEEASLPEVDEEFCRAYGVPEGGTESLRQEVRKSMERELTDLARSRVRAQVYEGLLKQNPLEVPRSMVEAQAQQMQIEAARQLGITDASKLPARDRFEAEARRRVALTLILGQIVQVQGLKVDRERMLARLSDIVAGFANPEEARRGYLNNAEVMRQIESSVLEEQVVEWVAAHAQVTEQTYSFRELTGFGREAAGSQNSENPT